MDENFLKEKINDFSLLILENKELKSKHLNDLIRHIIHTFRDNPKEMLSKLKVLDIKKIHEKEFICVEEEILFTVLSIKKIKENNLIKLIKINDSIINKLIGHFQAKNNKSGFINKLIKEIYSGKLNYLRQKINELRNIYDDLSEESSSSNFLQLKIVKKNIPFINNALSILNIIFEEFAPLNSFFYVLFLYKVNGNKIIKKYLKNVSGNLQDFYFELLKVDKKFIIFFNLIFKKIDKFDWSTFLEIIDQKKFEISYFCNVKIPIKYLKKCKNEKLILYQIRMMDKKDISKFGEIEEGSIKKAILDRKLYLEEN